MAPAAAGLDRYLAGGQFRPLRRRVLSTVTGDALPADADLRDLLVRQVREPVRFSEALGRLAADVDLLIEVGPGRVLGGLAAGIAPEVPAISLDTDATSLAGLLSTVAAAYVLGAPVQHDRLFGDRFTRPLPLDKEFRFFASPCESVPADSVVPYVPGPAALEARAGSEQQAPPRDGQDAPSALDILRRLAAERAELPVETVRPDSHPLDELHLSSITIGQVMNQAAKELGVSAPMVASNFATSTLADLAQSLDELLSTALPGDVHPDLPPEGVAPWVRAFSVELVDQPEQARAAALTEGEWQVFASPGHPLAPALARDLRAAHLGDGVLLCLPDECGAEHIGLMLQAARAALTHDRTCRFVTVHGERGAAGLAKTLHLEAPGVPTSVITLPLPAGLSAERVASLADAIVADVAATDRLQRGALRRVGHAPGPGAQGRPWPRRQCQRAARSRRATCCWSAAEARASPPNALSRWPSRRARRWRCSAGPIRPWTRSWPPTSAGWTAPG